MTGSFGTFWVRLSSGQFVLPRRYPIRGGDIHSDVLIEDQCQNVVKKMIWSFRFLTNDIALHCSTNLSISNGPQSESECCVRCRRHACHLCHSFDRVSHKVRVSTEGSILTQTHEEQSTDSYQHHVNGASLSTIIQCEDDIAGSEPG